MRRSILLAILIAFVAVAWMVSGQLPEFMASASDTTPAEETKTAAPVARSRSAVRVVRSTAQERPRLVVIHGHTEAIRKVDIKAETPGRVVDLPAAKGAQVKKGDIIARLALDERAAMLKEAEALVRQRQIEFTAAKRLKAKGFRAATSFAATEASLDAARAQVTRMKVDIAKTRVRAPFDGVIEAQPAELGAYLKVGEVVARLIDQDPYLVVGQLSQNDVAGLSPGDMARATLVTGQALEGRIRFIAEAADPETRTFRIELEVANPDGALRDGITAELQLPLGNDRAHRLSPALLVLDDKGVIGIRAVDDTDQVIFHPVEVLGDDADGVWVAGLPDSLDIITVGHVYVRAGLKVRVVRTGRNAGS